MGENDHSRASLIKAAKLYYLAELSQDQIAGIMGVSRSKVSRMLTMARAMKIVEFKISDSPQMTEQLAGKLKAHFGLKDVLVVPSEGTMEQTKRQIGRVASGYLNAQLKDHMRIGISWGTTVDAVISQFTPTWIPADLTVVQLTGGTRTPSFNLDSRDLTQALAGKLNAAYSLLHTPSVVSGKLVKEILLGEPEITAHFRLFEQLDIAVVGLGSNRPENSVPYRAGYITLEESEALVKAGFATDVCAHRIYKDGSVRPNLLSDRVIAVPPAALRKTPIVIGVAAGEDKAASIIAAAKGGFVKTLVIDEVAAILIMSMEDIQ